MQGKEQQRLICWHFKTLSWPYMQPSAVSCTGAVHDNHAQDTDTGWDSQAQHLQPRRCASQPLQTADLQAPSAYEAVCQFGSNNG